MIVSLALLGYAALLLTAGAPALARAGWPEHAPRLAITAWLALTGSALVSVILGGLALTVPMTVFGGGAAGMLAACLTVLRAVYAHPGGAALGGAGAVLALATLGRLTWCGASALMRAGRERRRHRRLLALIGQPDPASGAVIVGHREPAAYCLPGRGSQIVLTTGAVESLDPAQMRAVLAHERAHLRGRHHLLVTLAGAPAAAFPWITGFRMACGQVARLAELRADDEATTAVPRLEVAEALLRLGAPAFAAALAAGGPDTAARIRRLTTAPTPVGRVRAVSVAAGAVAVVLLPLVLIAGPPLVLGSHHCPHTDPGAATVVSPAAGATVPAKPATGVPRTAVLYHRI